MYNELIASKMNVLLRTLKRRIACIGGRPRTVTAVALLVVVCMLALCLLACTSAVVRPPSSADIAVQIVETGLVLPALYVAQPDTNDAASLAEAFGTYLQETPYKDIPVVALDNTVQITDYASQELGKTVADVYMEIREYIVTEAGQVKFRASEAQLGVERPVVVTLESGETRYSFELGQNVAALFSSRLEDYAPGATLRGFVMTLRYRQPGQAEDTIHGYVYMLRSDAYAAGEPGGEQGQ